MADEYYSIKKKSDDDELPSFEELAIFVDELVAKHRLHIKNDPSVEAAASQLPSTGDDLVIDLSRLSSSSSASKKELKKLNSALTTWGCFQVINHGIASSLLDEVREAVKKFGSSLSLKEQQKYSTKLYGYDKYGNGLFYDEWTPKFYRSKANYYPPHIQEIDFWLENPKDFSQVLHSYNKKLRKLLGILLKAMARSLDLKKDSFEGSNIGSVNGYYMNTRLNFCRPSLFPENVLGVTRHAENSMVTILLLDKEGDQSRSLQIMKQDEWYSIPVIPDALFFSAGELLEIISNGLYQNPPHRVVTLTNYEKGRVSVDVSVQPGRNAEIGPFDELVSAVRPRMYKTVKKSPKYPYYLPIPRKENNCSSETNTENKKKSLAQRMKGTAIWRSGRKDL